MPELPEVQVVINYLSQHICNRQITDVDVLLPKILKNISEKDFEKTLIGHSFKKVTRRGKYLLFLLDNDKVMVGHLRMEGKYNFEKPLALKKHDHIIFHFKDGSVLKYNDSRQFGTINIYPNEKTALASKELNKLGIEPFSEGFNVDYYYPLVHASKKDIKTFLLDQTKVVGIGNIYANEICFKAKIDPRTLACKLTKKDVALIVDLTKEILNESIKHNGTTIHSFTFSKWDTGNYQEMLSIYDKDNCSICHGPVQFFKLHQRGTYCCKKCQKRR